MVDYLENTSQFGKNQRLTEDEIIDIMDYSLPRDFQRQLLVQGFDSGGKDLCKLVEFCEHL